MVASKARRRRDEQLQRFIEHLGQFIEVQRALLFGSYAYGEPGEWSDIDLVIISPDFDGQDMLDRLRFLYQKAWEADTNWIEPLGYTREELESASTLSLLGEVRERGIVVYDSRGTIEKFGVVE